MTREEAAKAAEVMKAYADGKKIESTLKGAEFWAGGDEAGFDWMNFDYRIAEEPILVPWESEADVPWNCWVKRKSDLSGWAKVDGEQAGCVAMGGSGGERWLIGGFSDLNKKGVVAIDIGFLYYDRLFSDFLWSIDGKTWSPCGKVK